jgi:ABC-type transport system substrate-binding protein
MVASLEGGALDQVDSPGLLDLACLRTDPKYQALVVASSGQFVCMVANTTVAPTDNKTFRQAINYAINRQRFVDTVFQKIVTDAQDLPFPPWGSGVRRHTQQAVHIRPRQSQIAGGRVRCEFE